MRLAFIDDLDQLSLWIELQESLVLKFGQAFMVREYKIQLVKVNGAQWVVLESFVDEGTERVLQPLLHYEG